MSVDKLKRYVGTEFEQKLVEVFRESMKDIGK